MIGADGVHSAIRQHMFGTGRAQFTGIMAWRGLIPCSACLHICNAWSAPTGMVGGAMSLPIRCAAVKS